MVEPAACVRCGRVGPRIASIRTGLCTGCHRPAARPCGKCAKTAEIVVRATATTPDICLNCYELPIGTCIVCGRARPCNYVAEGRPTCVRCLPRSTAACAHCGADRPPTVRWPEGPVCDPCYIRALRRRGTCRDCGEQRRLVAPPGAGAKVCATCAGVTHLDEHVCAVCGIEDKLYERKLCDHCALGRRTRELLGSPDGAVPEALRGVHDAIVASPTPRKALNWLRQGAGAPILAAMAAGTMVVSHEALDEYPRPRAAGHVRHMLIAAGALNGRDDQLAALEHRIHGIVAGVHRPADRQTVSAFATWRVLRGVRRQAQRNTTRRTAITYSRNQVAAAVAFLDWLADHHLTLAECTQADVELWLAGPPWRYDVRSFVAWTAQRKLSGSLTVPPLRSGPGSALDAEQRWDIIDRLLHDDSVDSADRVAGCFVLCYAQPLSRIVAMTVDQITKRDPCSVRFGSQDIEMPAPLGALVAAQAGNGRTHHIGIGSPPTSPWLFPGHLPGRPITASRLGQRLSRYGIDARAARRAALQQLAAEVPAAVLADLLGIGIKTAVDWVKAAGGDWATYAGLIANNRSTAP